MATYTLRTFSVKNLKLKKRLGCDRIVYQYHYTNWPDHGVPDHPLPVLSFVRKSAAANPSSAGPIICHCSAGCGRSGTYIAIDAMLKQIRHRQSINVVDFLKHIRTQRNYLVQTEEQYIFIHDALAEAIESGDTEISSNFIAKYIQLLQTGGGSSLQGSKNQSAYSLANGLCQSPQQQQQQPADQQQQLISVSNSNLLIANDANTKSSSNRDSKSGAGSQATTVSRCHSGQAGQWSLLERQYRLVASFKAKDFNVVSALKPFNKHKNRTLSFIPLEAHRVHITPKPGTDGSDYINATFLMGFNHLREFILTQHPVNETFSDFWQMVYDHNAQTIVLLTAIGATSESEFAQFWPQKEDEVDYGSFKVKLTQESTLVKGGAGKDGGGGNLIITRDFIMRSNQDDYELQTKIIHCPGWPEFCGPLAGVFDLIQVVQQASQDRMQNAGGQTQLSTVTIGQEHEPQNGGPIIVVDKFGGTEAATFAVLTTLYKQMNFEDAVDVYMYAKLAHLRRPGIWNSQDDYLFLYRAIENYASILQQQQQQQQHQHLSAGDSKQSGSLLSTPISFASQTMTLDRHRHKAACSLKTSTMRRPPRQPQQSNRLPMLQPGVNGARGQQVIMPVLHSATSTAAQFQPTATPAPSHNFGAEFSLKTRTNNNNQLLALDHNHNYTISGQQTLPSANIMMGIAQAKGQILPKGSPYNSAASIGASSHQHLLAANSVPSSAQLRQPPGVGNQGLASPGAALSKSPENYPYSVQ